MASPTWVYPDIKTGLLFIGIEEDQHVAYISMTLDLLEEWNKREFTLLMLDAHPGIVADFYHDHAWTLEEIKKDMPWNGIHFLRPHIREQSA